MRKRTGMKVKAEEAAQGNGDGPAMTKTERAQAGKYSDNQIYFCICIFYYAF